MTDPLAGCVTPSADVRALLERCLEGRDLDVEGAARLMGARGRDLLALQLVADELRQRQVGEVVTYVVNRNVNFTNVCIKTCRFCAFARGVRSEQAYFLPVEEVVRRAVEARDLGASEVCLQAGLAPTLSGSHYVDLVRAVRAAAPELHLHAFSPEEVKYGAALSRVSVREYLLALREAGLGSLPGTSAEILDDELRDRISPGRIRAREWIDVIRTAHDLGIPTTSTMMFGHVETRADRARHLILLRSLQRETGGFTELVPLSFVHEEAPLFVRGDVAGVDPGPSGDEVVALYAVARLTVGADIPNLQASWVKEGLRAAQRLLSCGVNDLGGTLMNESISTSAGAAHGQLATPATLRQLARDAGRLPAERDTRYGLRRRFGREPTDDEAHPLDAVDDADERFGSYAQLTADAAVRYRGKRLRVVP